MDVVQQSFEKLKKSNATAFEEFTAAFEEGFCKKGHYLHDVGQISRELYFIKSGIIKLFRYREDGSEFITWFCFENELAVAYRSFVKCEPSEYGLIAMEDCTYLKVSRDTCYGLVEKYHEMETFFREMLEDYFIEADERMFLLMALSVKQKYEYIAKNHLHFLQRLPLKEIASFIGTSRETLSRIRKFV